MRYYLITLILAFAMILSGCSLSGQQANGSANGEGGSSSDTDTSANSYSRITAEKAHERITSGDPVVIVDVRTAEEYKEKHIPGAILIPNEEITDVHPSMLPVLNAEILVYCRSGNRSEQASKKLISMGYTNVSDFGGINDWTYDTESGDFETPVKSGTLSSFSTFDINGVQKDETIFKDYKLTMINIWATFCSPCLGEMPELGKLSSEYADKGVQIIGIVADVYADNDGTFPLDMIVNAQQLVLETKADYTHLLPSADLISAKLGAVTSVPETLFVDSSGNILGDSYVGSRSGDEWAKIINSKLNEVS